MGRDRRRRGLSVVLAGLLVAGCGSQAPPRAKLAPSRARCPAGFEQGPTDTCFSLPSAPTASTATVLYVHSASNETAIAQELELVKSSLGQDMVVLYARGSESECALASDVRATFCWPGADDTASSQRIWEHWDEVQWQAEALLPEGTHPRLVLGYREGAAFAARAFKRGAIQANVVAVVAPGEQGLEPGAYPDWLVGVGAPASSEALFTGPSTSAASCPRERADALLQSDLDQVVGVFRAVLASSKAGMAPLAVAPCRLHVANRGAPAGRAGKPTLP